MSVYAPWSAAFYYSPGEIVAYNAADYRATSEQPNQGNQPDISVAYWTVYSNGGQNVVSAINAGNGITVADGQSADPTISTNLTAGTGVSITAGTGTELVVANTGVITATAGTGLSNSGTATNPVFNNTGVLSAGTGLGISNTGTATAPIITNTGVSAAAYGSASKTLTATVNAQGQLTVLMKEA